MTVAILGIATPNSSPPESRNRDQAGTRAHILSARLETVSDALPTTWKRRAAMAAAMNGSLNGPDPPINRYMWRFMGCAWDLWVTTSDQP